MGNQQDIISSNTTSYAELLIRGYGLNLDEITKELNANPTRQYKKGEFIDNSLRVYKCDGWEYKTETTNSFDLDCLLDEITDLFDNSGVESYLNKLKEDKTVNISFELVNEIEDGNTPGIYFDESFVSFLNRIGASIDVDLYVL